MSIQYINLFKEVSTVSTMSPKEALIGESISLPLEIRDRMVSKVQISFLFDDGSMHHVKPDDRAASKRLAADCQKENPIHYEQWEFLTTDETEV